MSKLEIVKKIPSIIEIEKESFDIALMYPVFFMFTKLIRKSGR